LYRVSKKAGSLPLKISRIVRGKKLPAGSAAAMQGQFCMPFQVVVQTSGNNITLSNDLNVRREVLSDFVY
jgi:hypothetical protein